MAQLTERLPEAGDRRNRHTESEESHQGTACMSAYPQRGSFAVMAMIHGDLSDKENICRAYVHSNGVVRQSQVTYRVRSILLHD